MKKIKVTPLKARVKGNLIPNFDDLKNPPKFEDYHVSHQSQPKTTYQGVSKGVIRLSPQGEKLYMTVTTDTPTVHPGETATVVCTLTYKSGNDDMYLSGQTVHVYDNGSLVKTEISDEQGEVTYDLTTNVEGKHTISFKTVYANGFDPASGSKDIVIYTKTELTLNPKSISIGHDEMVTLSGKLSTNSGIGLASKPVILMEGAERTLATVITDEEGKYTYKYIESSNRGTPTVLTATTIPTFVQNTYNEIIGYLKTNNGTPISGQKVRLYYGYNAYERCHAITDNNGKYTLRYKPTDSVEREYYIVFCSTVENTTNNEYEIYEPSFLSIGNQRALKSPALTITNTTLTTTVNEPLTINMEVKDTGDSKVTFNNETVLAQYSTNKSTWVDLQQLTINKNKCSFQFSRPSAGTYYIRFTYNGNSDYVGGISDVKTISVTREAINLSTVLYNNGTCHMMDNYPITTTVTNSKGNLVSGEVIKFYLDSETEANLIGTATTDTKGVATLIWNANPPNVVVKTYTLITKHEQNTGYEAKTRTDSLKVVKRTRQFSVTSGDSVTVGHEYLLEGELTYTTHYTNYFLKCNNHDITIETKGLNRQPLLYDDWIQADLLTTSTTTNVEPLISSEGMDVGQKGTVYYKYPITITEDLDIIYEFKLKLDTGAYDGRIALLRFDDNGNLEGHYDYWLPKSTYGENPTIRIHIVGNVLTLTEVISGTLIRERELNIENTNKYYIGFLSSTAGKVIVESMCNELQPLINYPITNLDNWYRNTYPGVDESTQNVQNAYVGENGYVFQGIRKGFVLKRPIDFSKDKYIKVETYQKEVWMRVGMTTLDENNEIIVNKYQYVYVNQIGLATADLSNFSVFKYEFRVQPDGTVKAFVNGVYIKNINFSSNETPYICIYATSQNDYVKTVTIRQDTIHLKTNNGAFSTSITPAMLGEYRFEFTVETMDAYYGLHRQKTLYSVEKEFPMIVLYPIETEENFEDMFYIDIPEDAYAEFGMKIYDSDDNEYIQPISYTNNGSQLEIYTSYNYPKGHYTYSIQYEGDDYYAEVETEKETLDIRGDMEVSLDNEIGGVITANAKSIVKIKGTILNSFGESFNGTLNASSFNLPIQETTVTDGRFETTIDLNAGFFPISPGDHLFRLSCNDGYKSFSEQYTLRVVKLTTTIAGYNTGIIKNTNSLPRWQCKVPKDYKGKIYVYLVNEQGEYYTGTASSSIISSTNGISSSDLHTDTIQGTSDYVNVWWEGKWDGNNTTVVNKLKNDVGVYTIKYVLINDSMYNNAESLATYYLRQPATITTDTNIRKFENEDVPIGIRAYDPLGNAMNGTITAKVGSTSQTIQITNGTGTFTLPASNRKYSTTNHITTVDFTYKYAESGYWSGCNNTVSAKTYNIKTNTYGIFINAPESTNFDKNQYLKLSSLGITDLYVRANTQTADYVYLEAIQNVINYLTTSDHRNEFRIHAVFNCVKQGDTWFIENNKVTQERINDLKTHISNLLQLDIDGICFDYIRRGSTTPDNSYEPDISNFVRELSNYVKENTQNKTIMISACVIPEYTTASTNYGQSYSVFEEVCDYVIPMIYMYDYSSRNETTPRNSYGYLWQQRVIRGISNIAHSNKVFPAITTYHGDSNVSTLSDKEDLLYQIRGMWNYGLPGNELQQSVILFRAGLLSNDCISWKELTDKGTDGLSVQIEPKIENKTLKKATDKLLVSWRTKWGGHVGSLGTAMLKIDGETQNVNVPVQSGTNLEIPLSLSNFKTGQHSIQIVYGGNKTYDVASGIWNETITLQ